MSSYVKQSSSIRLRSVLLQLAKVFGSMYPRQMYFMFVLLLACSRRATGNSTSLQKKVSATHFSSQGALDARPCRPNRAREGVFRGSVVPAPARRARVLSGTTGV